MYPAPFMLFILVSITGWESGGSEEKKRMYGIPAGGSDANVRQEEMQTMNEEKKKGNILYVDDDFALLKTMLTSAEGLGYTVLPVENPDIAVKLFISNPDDFDLVITDMRMQKMDGGRLLEELKAIRPDVPLILCSGSTELTREDACALGFRTFLRKPVNLAEMADAVRQALLPPIPVDAGENRGPVRVMRTFHPSVEKTDAPQI